MANRLKSKKSQKAGSGKLKAENDPKVTVKEIVKDERTHKITGAVLLLLAAFLFIAFTSYLFTWKEDQDKVFRGASILAPSSEVKVANLLGHLGAWVSYQFFNNGFGLASYLFSWLSFVIGANLLFKRPLFAIGRHLRYIVAGLFFFCVSLAFVTRHSAFPWGGAVGDLLDDLLIRLLGWLGTAALLFVAALAFVIWRFNPVFKVPKVPALPLREKQPLVSAESAQEGARLFVEEGFSNMNLKGNILKEEGGVVAISPREEWQEGPANGLLLVEREDAESETDEPDPFEPASEEEEDELFDDIPTMINRNDPSRGSGKAAAPEPELEIKAAAGNELAEGENEDRPAVSGPLPDYEPTLDLRDYQYPSLELLEAHGSEKIVQDATELEANKNQIIRTLSNYDISIQKISATVGPTVTLYEIVPAAGVRISRIKNLEDDIALSLAALGIRIIAPIPGKGTIGIEVPNVRKTVVSMRTLLSSDKFQHSNFSLPIAIGKKIDNDNFIVDLAAMPHLLMAGATGQGKSVGLNAILISLLYKKHPSQLKLVLVDPKKVELSLYRTIEKHFLAKLPGEEEAIITDTKKVIHTLNALCTLMDIRYDLLKEAGARNIKEYNDKFIKRKLNPLKGHEYLPFIVLVIDEFADLIMTAGKEVEMPIARLAQLARAVGIHLIIATQRPSVNIITGTIKANFPARIGFKVSSKIDSRTILDSGGADQLIGKGDMLISYNGEITRVQCAFVDTPEVEEITDFIGRQRGYPQAFLLPEYTDEKEMEGKEFDLEDRDPLFDDAARLIVQNQIGSTSLIQRRMKLGYNRAGRLMDQLEAAGVVGAGQGSKPRDVLIKTEHELDEYLRRRTGN
ncbi:MAG: DNA translocase FtsK 4TM domain-containing protein [Bacteroidota bacterium]|nr:DNA translocase FtsK 4TM domain-containing protein [Bacteroidota bacterium]MDP4245802.1 DNA translocase FtsK 4TM domain-containing protein [Bacteroidota bacterium]MDP4256979.1 DNA translocase FtsK 4TM domain-containing protein [Bacteroidota bacterium]